jgi:sialic acid synthase SpsE
VKELRIDKETVKKGRRCFVIAELGNTHEGSIGLAKCFIKAASDCGADAVKLQTHIFEAESLPDAPNPPYFNNESRKEYFERTSFDLEQYKELKRYAEEQCSVEFISSPFSLEAVDLLESVGVSTYKVASGEVSNIPLLVKLAEKDKKILLSSGMSHWAELDEAVDALCRGGCKDVVVMQCCSEYPCPVEHAGLNVMMDMKRRYNLPVGFSDHTLGIAIAIAAAACGAVVIEKHFTLSKKMYGSDAKSSATPEEFEALVGGIRDVEKALSNEVDKDKTARSLSQMKVIFEKSIVAACDLEAGSILGENHLAYKKPGDGIPAKKFRQLIGRRMVKPAPKNAKLDWQMIQQ